MAAMRILFCCRFHGDTEITINYTKAKIASMAMARIFDILHEEY